MATAKTEKGKSRFTLKKDDKKPNAKKAPSKSKDKDKKPRRNPIRYIKEVISEIKKVTWPTRKELVTYSVAVFAFIVAFTLVIWLMDLGLTPLFQWLIKA